MGHPLEFAKLTLTKALMFWGPTEVSHNKEDELERRHYTALHVMPIQFGLIMTISFAGATAVAVEIMGNRRRRKHDNPQQKRHAGRAALVDAHLSDWRPISTAISVLMFFYVLAFFLSILPFFNAGRYRIPIVPFLLFFCAIAFERCAHYFRRQRKLYCFGIIGTMVAAFVVMSVWPFEYKPDLSNWHYARGVCFARTDRIDQAITEYESAIRADDANAKAHFNLGMLLQKVGRTLEAARHLDAVAATGAYELEAKRAKAQALVSGGHLDAAAVELESVLAQYPDDRASLLMLAAIRADQGRIDDAAGLYKTAIALKPGDSATHYNFGATLAAAGRIEPAIEQFQAAINANPNFFEAHNNLAASLVQLNRLDEAVAAFRAALRVEPGSREAAFESCAGAGPAIQTRRSDRAVEVVANRQSGRCGCPLAYG
ncbi:MAG: tetratricopeptide repeat protein [Planctomycetes bacterium]|nr:tetratricopeptide repeat protein [Planctomycetota bacterium]